MDSCGKWVEALLWSSGIFLSRGRAQDHDKLAGLFKQHFNITLEVKDISFKGWNWGVTDFQGLLLYFLIASLSD